MPATNRCRSEPAANHLLADRHAEAHRWQRVLQGNGVHAMPRRRLARSLLASTVRAVWQLALLALAILAWLGQPWSGV